MESPGALDTESQNRLILQMGNQVPGRAGDLPKIRQEAEQTQHIGMCSSFQAPLPSKDQELGPWLERNHRLEKNVVE